MSATRLSVALEGRYRIERVAVLPLVRAPAGEPKVIFNWFTELRRLSVQQRSPR